MIRKKNWNDVKEYIHSVLKIARAKEKVKYCKNKITTKINNIFLLLITFFNFNINIT